MKGLRVPPGSNWSRYVHAVPFGHELRKLIDLRYVIGPDSLRGNPLFVGVYLYTYAQGPVSHTYHPYYLAYPIP